MRLFKEETVAVDWTCVTNGERGEDIGEQTKDGPTKRNIEVYNVGLEGTTTDGSTIIRAEATTVGRDRAVCKDFIPRLI